MIANVGQYTVLCVVLRCKNYHVLIAGQGYASHKNIITLEGYIVQQGGKLMRQIQCDFKHLTKLAYNCRKNISYV